MPDGGLAARSNSSLREWPFRRRKVLAFAGIASGRPDPCAKAMPVGSGPKTRPTADSDETGQPSARTLLFGIFGGKSPHLRALLPHRETGESVKDVKEKKDGLDRARRAEKRIPSKNGGGGPVSQHKQISQI
jgi:hypothetical protein